VRYIGADTLLGIPVPLIIFLVTAVLIAVFLERTRLGKYIYMSGSNINATHFSLAMWGAVLIVVLALKFFRNRFLHKRGQKRSGRNSAAAS